MTQEKKTIQLANGTAEEGDRVAIIYTNGLGVKEGILKELDEAWDQEFGVDADWTDHGAIPLGDYTVPPEQCILLFSQDDALEAIEEQREALRKSSKDPLNGMSKEFLDAIEGEFDNIKDRIQQKRNSR